MFNLQYPQIKTIILGLGGLFIFRYYYRTFIRQYKQIQQQKNKFKVAFERSKKELTKQIFQLDKQKLSNRKNAQQICCLSILAQLNKSSFRLQKKQHIKQFHLQPMEILQNVIGGDFKFKYKDSQIKCVLKDTHVSHRVLIPSRKDIKLFKNNQLKPILQQIVYSFDASMMFSIFGKIYYDSDILEWTLQPLFITNSFEFSRFIQRYYQLKQAKASLKVIGIVFGMTMFSFFMIWTPLKGLVNKIKNKYQYKIQENGGRENYNYKSIKYIKVKPSSQLNCEKCKEKSVQIVYDCGHLSICGACHQRNHMYQCPLCLKPVNKYFKIFMA